MKIVKVGNKRYLSFKYHELAFSRRTMSIEQYILDEQGNIIKTFYPEKKAFVIELPDNAKYFLRRYFTNRGYPEHTLYELPTLQIVFKLNRYTTFEDILTAEIPENLKKLLMEELTGDC